MTHKHSLFFLPAVLLVSSLGFFLASCGDDNDESVPTEVANAFKGSYQGPLVAICEQRPFDSLKTNILAEVDGENIHISELPVALVVDSVFGRGTADSLGITNAAMSIGYKLYNASADYYPLSYDPQPITVQVNKNGTPHELTISFYGKGSDFLFYFPASRRLEMSLRTSSVRQDGKQVYASGKPNTPLAFRYSIQLFKENLKN